MTQDNKKTYRDFIKVCKRASIDYPIFIDNRYYFSQENTYFYFSYKEEGGKTISKVEIDYKFFEQSILPHLDPDYIYSLAVWANND